VIGLIRLMLACGHYQLIADDECPGVFVGDFATTSCIHCRPAMQCQIVGMDPIPSIFTREGAQRQQQVWDSFAQAVRPDPERLRVQFEELGSTREEPHG
jgi:hypothetical protein